MAGFDFAAAQVKGMKRLMPCESSRRLNQVSVTHKASVSSLTCPAHLVDYGPAAASSTLPGS
ncbi:hypothetical protein E2C01_055331 [Portunus trituberculatus]|uniref:Uncharacterized protein n=1 Tax=Portunus trituberculatus TaxID=210409 RepID=A0A5B7GXE2_PORTR|nr:hypothetical protein [Portunus trituberculatus]